jgi:hypothetical protein
MIRVSVMHPSGEGKKFDYDYYVNKHMTLVKNRVGGAGLRRLEELFADVPNFTDITPQVQISEINHS